MNIQIRTGLVMTALTTIIASAGLARVGALSSTPRTSCACGTSHESTSTPHRSSPRSAPRDGTPFALLFTAFVEAGYEDQQAADLASGWLDSWKREVDGEVVQELDWSRTSLFASLVDAFVFAGRSAQEAADIVAEVWPRLPIGHDPESASEGGDDDPCIAYVVNLVYCTDDPPRKRTTQRVIDAACFENIMNCPTTLQCLGPNIRWVTVTISDTCDDALAGFCIYLGDIVGTGPIQVNCDKVNFGCECIVEANPSLQCDEIEHACGPEKWGPDGCPDCDPENE